MCYAFISTIQALREQCKKHTKFSRGTYNGHSQEFHMEIMSSLCDYMLHYP